MDKYFVIALLIAVGVLTSYQREINQEFSDAIAARQYLNNEEMKRIELPLSAKNIQVTHYKGVIYSKEDIYIRYKYSGNFLNNYLLESRCSQQDPKKVPYEGVVPNDWPHSLDNFNVYQCTSPKSRLAIGAADEQVMFWITSNRDQ